MTNSSNTEHDILLLIEDVQAEIDRYEASIAVLRDKLYGYNVTLSDWRKRFGGQVSDSVLVESLSNATVRQMLERWAEAHGGTIVMKDLTRVTVEANLFKNREQAAGSLYATIGRLTNLFRKVDRGVYVRIARGLPPIEQHQTRVLDGVPEPKNGSKQTDSLACL